MVLLKYLIFKNLIINISELVSIRINQSFRLYPFLCEWVVEHGGSISAEHGIGQERRPYKNIGKGYEIKMAEHIKRIFDPRYILSPYKMIYNENV